jgi:hypothetical protein
MTNLAAEHANHLAQLAALGWIQLLHKATETDCSLSQATELVISLLDAVHVDPTGTRIDGAYQNKQHRPESYSYAHTVFTALCGLVLKHASKQMDIVLERFEHVLISLATPTLANEHVRNSWLPDLCRHTRIQLMPHLYTPILHLVAQTCSHEFGELHLVSHYISSIVRKCGNMRVGESTWGPKCVCFEHCNDNIAERQWTLTLCTLADQYDDMISSDPHFRTTPLSLAITRMHAHVVQCLLASNRLAVGMDWRCMSTHRTLLEVAFETHKDNRFAGRKDSNREMPASSSSSSSSSSAANSGAILEMVRLHVDYVRQVQVPALETQMCVGDNAWTPLIPPLARMVCEYLVG